MELYIHLSLNIHGTRKVKKSSKFYQYQFFRIYISLEKIGELAKSNVEVKFGKESVDVKIRGYNNQNLRFIIILRYS